MGDYVYSSITTPGIVRLILLEPSIDLEAELRCTLIDTSLRDCDDDIVEHYVALSYVWGDASQKKLILVDNKTVEVTVSLECALRHVRDPKRVLRIWADGVCINQKEALDKNIQVASMGKIYSSARHTIIFLGTSMDDSRYIQMTSDCHCREERLRDRQECWRLDKKYLSMEAVLLNSWFTRTWTLQELVLSPDPWIQCGNSRVRWDMFQRHFPTQDIVHRHRSIYNQARGHPEVQRLFFDIANIRTDFQVRRLGVGKAAKDYFSDILQKRRGSGCSDPKDIVYAHLGMCKDSALIEIDYTKSVAEVYTDATRHYLSKNANISILYLVPTVTREVRPEGLPSWVPDWGTIGTIEREDLQDGHYVEAYVTSKESNVLSFSGSRFEKVVYVLEQTQLFPRDSGPSRMTAEDSTYRAVLKFIIYYLQDKGESFDLISPSDIPSSDHVLINELLSEIEFESQPSAEVPRMTKEDLALLLGPCIQLISNFLYSLPQNLDLVLTEDEVGLELYAFSGPVQIGDILYAVEDQGFILLHPSTRMLDPEIILEIYASHGVYSPDKIKVQGCSFGGVLWHIQYRCIGMDFNSPYSGACDYREKIIYAVL